MIKIYKVRDKKSKLCSTGGCKPEFRKTGKCWSCEGSLKSHFTMLLDKYNSYNKSLINDWEIIEITIEDDDKCLCGLRIYPASELANRPAKK